MGQPNLNQHLAKTAQQQARLAQAEAEAARHGIHPFQPTEDLRGDFWPEEENLDEFLVAVNNWRKIPARRTP